MILLFAGCLINSDLYEQQLLVLQDLDRDGFSPQQGDCDDQNVDANPLAVEVCDGIDNDCNGQVDEVEYVEWFFDQDGDGFGGGLQMSTFGCTPPEEGWIQIAGDCDDENPRVFPGATENWLNGFVDNNCDGGLEDIIQDMTPFENDLDNIEEMIVVGSSVLAHSSGGVYLFSEEVKQIVSSDETVSILPNMISLQDNHFIVEQKVPTASSSFFRRYVLQGNRAEKISGFLGLDDYTVLHMASLGDYLGTGDSMFVFSADANVSRDLFFVESGWEEDLFAEDVPYHLFDVTGITGEVWSVGDIDEDGYNDIGLGGTEGQRISIFLGGEQPELDSPFWTLYTTNDCKIYTGGDLTMDHRQDIGCAKNFAWVFGEVYRGGTDDLDSATVMYRSEEGIASFNSYSSVAGQGRALLELQEPTVDGVAVFLAWESQGTHEASVNGLGLAAEAVGSSVVTKWNDAEVLIWWNGDSVFTSTLPAWP